MTGELTNHIWQSTVFAAGVALLAAVLRKNRADVRYALWLTASFKFLVPFALLMSLGSNLKWAPAAKKIAAPAVSAAMQQIAQPFPNDISLTLPAGATLTHSEWLLPAVFGIWACGFLAITWMRVRAWRRLREAVRSSTPLEMEAGQVPQGMEVRSASGILEPGVHGLFRPMLLLPAGIAERLTTPQLDAVLAHELCHVRRRDNLTSAAHMVIEAVFWFHPLVWWIGARLLEERERACDENVLGTACQPRAYADGILNVCKFYMESPLHCVSGVSGANIKRRLEAIMMERVGQPLAWAKVALLVVAGAVGVVGPVGIGIVNAQAPNSFSGMQTSASKVFEVATVKPSSPDAKSWHLGPPGHGAVDIGNLDLKKIIASSFRIQDTMVFGPGWLETAKYDIVGKGPDPSVANPEVWEMMRSLLAERFKMKYHVESREFPIYALTVAKGGPKLKKPEEGRCAEDIKAGKNCGDIIFPPFGVGIYNMQIGALIGGLGRYLQNHGLPQRPMVDKTGLTGKYDVIVTWMPEGITPEQLESIPKESRPEDINMFQAMEQQAGLKLEAQKAPIQVVVVDRIEKPSEN
jgi:uncharacterized protein (TIGR03435 family)